MSGTFQAMVHVAAPRATVYRALTDPAALRAWLAEFAEVSLPERHFEFWGRYTPQGERGRQQLLIAQPDKLLSFAWTLDGTRTNVMFQLQDAGPSATLLALSQDGIPPMEELMAPTGRRDGLHTLHTFWGLALANLAEWAEGRELTPRCDFSASRPNEIRLELTIPAPPSQVFDSLIDPARIARWFGWEAEVEPRVGGRITLGADGTISEFQPGRLLAYAEPGMTTRWELTEAGGKTRLTFLQQGFQRDELDNVAQHEAGWAAGLAELKRLHELGPRWQPLIGELAPQG
ncbi:SRPBCC family protein [Archangium violaceum]|uniref:SRPBCC family protein n=1 Tax=Archangium violaceum TaxID=83451 RepID=UPI0036DB3B6D